MTIMLPLRCDCLLSWPIMDDRSGSKSKSEATALKVSMTRLLRAQIFAAIVSRGSRAQQLLNY